MIRNLLTRIRMGWAKLWRVAQYMMGRDVRDAYMVTAPTEPVPGENGRFKATVALDKPGLYFVHLLGVEGSPVCTFELPPGAVITSMSVKERWTGREWPVDVVSQEPE